MLAADQVIGSMVEISGTHQQSQRLFRDMNITAAHAYTNYDLCAEAMGRELMGLAPDPAVAPAP